MAEIGERGRIQTRHAAPQPRLVALQDLLDPAFVGNQGLGTLDVLRTFARRFLLD